MEKNEYWNKEEFEDLVARGLIAMYESKIKKHKDVVKHARFTPDMLDRVRRIGCYYPSEDRVIVINHVGDIDNSPASAIQEIDIINDGRPDFAAFTYKLNKTDQIHDSESMRHNCYAEHTYIERIINLPSPIQCKYDGRKYRLIKMWINNLGFLEACCNYIVIDSKGNIYGTYWLRQSWDNNFIKSKMERVDSTFCQTPWESKNAEDIITVDASSAIQCWQDRRFLWNVVAKEGIAKVTFSVYPEQIKSLFYAREMPMTETGRKRPILHWVAAHQRRIKKGIDIDIEKHLRGINEFVYHGTKFTITRPLKKQK